jgi:hypothetical protein
LIATALLFSGLVGTASGQVRGFGKKSQNRANEYSGKKAVIKVRIAPRVYVPGPSVGIQVISAKPVGQAVSSRIRRLLEESLTRNDPRLTIDNTNPDTLIVCTIADVGIWTGIEGRTRSEYRKIGERTVHDSTTGMSRTEDEHGFVDVPYRALVIEGRMSVEYEIRDVKTGLLLHNGRFDPVYTEVIRDVTIGSSTSADNLNRIYLELGNNAVGHILNQVSPRAYSDIVLLPKGKLKEVDKMLGSGSWSDSLIVLNSMPPFKNSNDEAHRLYAIGIANEALAYRKDDPGETTKHLERAVEQYRRATVLKPGEDSFWWGKNRAEQNLLSARILVAQQEALEKQAAQSPRRPTSEMASVYASVISRPAVSPPITNDVVIGWVKSGVSREYITESVRHAPRSMYDLSPAETLRLRQEGVSGATIRAMKDSQPNYYKFGLPVRAAILAGVVPFLVVLPFIFAR